MVKRPKQKVSSAELGFDGAASVQMSANKYSKSVFFVFWGLFDCLELWGSQWSYMIIRLLRILEIGWAGQDIVIKICHLFQTTIWRNQSINKDNRKKNVEILNAHSRKKVPKNSNHTKQKVRFHSTHLPKSPSSITHLPERYLTPNKKPHEVTSPPTTAI